MAISIRDIASAFNVSERTIYRWIESGKLKDESLAAIVDTARAEGIEQGKKEMLATLREQGWLRRKPWPSRKHLVTFNPWL